VDDILEAGMSLTWEKEIMLRSVGVLDGDSLIHEVG
jgi:hypothetical protein